MTLRLINISFCIYLSVCFCLAAFASAQAPAPAAKEATSLTIYSTARPGAIPPELYRPSRDGGGFPQQPVPGYAVIRQERMVNIEQQRSTVRFDDVAELIDPTTVSFASLTDPESTSVLDQNYQFDLVSTAKLMEKFIDKTISVDQVRGDKVETISGTLLSTAGGLVLKMSDGGVQVLTTYSNAKFPQLPGGLITKPTLVWDVNTAEPGPHRVRVGYQTTGVTWWADYNLVFSEGKDANSGLLDVGAWVSIINQCGASFNDAKLKLVAGDVHRAPQPQQNVYPMALARGGEMRNEALGFQEQSFFEYHLYTLGRPATLPDRSTKQVELFPTARGVPCEKVLVYYGLAGQYGIFGSPMTDRNFGVQSNTKVDTYLKFKNDKDAGMGMPLPSGRIRVSKQDPKDGSLEFIGEDVIDHTAKDEPVLIKLGSAFDVVGERKQLDFRVDTARDWMEEDIEIKIRNHKSESVKVIIKENLYRWVNWEMKAKTHEFEKVDARTVHFPVTVEKDKEMTLKYTVHYSW